MQNKIKLRRSDHINGNQTNKTNNGNRTEQNRTDETKTTRRDKEGGQKYSLQLLLRVSGNIELN
jgi:hypothetical protein